MNRIISKILLGAALVFITPNLFAQNVKEAAVSFQKQNVNGFSADYNIGKSDLEKVAAEYFAKNINVKRGKAKPFYVFRGGNWTAVPSLSQGDVYYSVSGSKSNSTLTVLVSKGYDNYVSRSTDPNISTEVANFFSSFQQEIDKYTLKQRIAEQETLIKKLEKEQASYTKEDKKLKDKIKSIEKDIENNNKKNEKQLAEIEKQKQTLADLKSQL